MAAASVKLHKKHERHFSQLLPPISVAINKRRERNKNECDMSMHLFPLCSFFKVHSLVQALVTVFTRIPLIAQSSYSVKAVFHTVETAHQDFCSTRKSKAVIGHKMCSVPE